MRAIILAAGQGTRLLPLTENVPKCLVEYQGKALIDYQLETFRACGINDIVIIKGYCADVLIRNGVKYAFNERFATTNMVSTFFCADQYFNDDIIVSYGDIIYGPDILEPLIQSPHDFAVAISTSWRELWKKRMADPLQDAETLKLAEGGRITELGKKPKGYEEIEGQYMGLFKISKSFMPKLKEIYMKMDRKVLYDGRDFNNMFMTSFIQYVIDQGHPVMAVKVAGPWLEIDRLEDLKVASEISS